MKLFDIKKYRDWMPVFFVICCALLLGNITAMYAFTADDLIYSSSYYGYMFHSEPFPGFGPWIDFFIHHAENINGRFGDKLLILYMLLPRWLMGICQALCFYGIVAFSMRIAVGDLWRKSYRTIIFASILVLTFPWYDNGFLACMFINYQVGVLISVMWVYYFLHTPKKTWYTGIFIAILSFCAGSWHECFSFIIFPSVIIIQCLRKDRGIINYISVCCFFLGVLFILCCPGFWARMGYAFNVGNQVWLLSILKPLYCIPFILYVIVLLWRKVVCKRTDYLSFNDWMFVGMAVNLILGTTYLSEQVDSRMFRIWWYALTFGLIGSLIVSRRWRMPRVFRVISLIAISLITMVHLSISVYSQYQIKGEYDEVMYEFRNSPNGVVYFDNHAYEYSRLAALRKPQRDIFMHYTLDCTGLQHPQCQMLKLFPTELKKIDTLALKYIEGSDSMYYTPQGHLLCKSLQYPSDLRLSSLIYVTEAGDTTSRRVTTCRVPSQRDTSYIYLRLQYFFSEDRDEVMHPIGVYVSGW